METAMKMDRRKSEGSLIFDINGDFDTRSAGPAKEEIRAAILEGEKSVIINLENVGYIDSAGLGTLVSALKTAKENNGNVCLTGLTAQVKMVVELTRLHHVFDIFPNVEAALEGLKGRRVSEAQ